MREKERNGDILCKAEKISKLDQKFLTVTRAGERRQSLFIFTCMLHVIKEINKLS